MLNSLKLEIPQNAVNKFACMKQERRSDECKFGVCLPCCTWSSLFHEGLVTKCQKPMFCSKMQNFALILKIFVGYIEWAFRHPHVNYLSDWMILKF